MKARILYNTDGTVSIIHPAPKSRREDETEEQWLERVFTKSTPTDATFKDVDEALLPQDRDFRNAWGKGAEGIDIDILKAKNITKDRLRLERKPLFEEQDVLYMKALESGLDTKAIVTEKQRLRDITKQADSATSLADLKALKVKE